MLHRTVSAVALLLLTSAPAAAAPCSTFAGGDLVVLKASDIDPDVFVWDTKSRVVEYAAGRWRDTRDVLSHTVLSAPGTRAVIVACQSGVIKSRYADETLDAVGIRLLNGPYHGRYGWVTSEDVHAAAKAALH